MTDLTPKQLREHKRAIKFIEDNLYNEELTQETDLHQPLKPNPNYLVKETKH